MNRFQHFGSTWFDESGWVRLPNNNNLDGAAVSLQV